MDYITIIKGDDTNFLEDQFVVVSFNTNTIGQLTSFQSDEKPTGNVFKAGQDIIGVKNYSSAS